MGQKVKRGLFLGKPYNHDHSRPTPEEDREKRLYFEREALRAGDRAPDFSLPSLDGGEVRPADLRGRPTVIEFGSIT